MLLSNTYAVSSCRDKVRDAGASFDWLKRIGNSSSLPKPLLPFSEGPEVGVNLISQPKFCPKSHFPVYIFAQIPVPLSVFLFLNLSPNDLNLIFPVKKKGKSQFPFYSFRSLFSGLLMGVRKITASQGSTNGIFLTSLQLTERK